VTFTAGYPGWVDDGRSLGGGSLSAAGAGPGMHGERMLAVRSCSRRRGRGAARFVPWTMSGGGTCECRLKPVSRQRLVSVAVVGSRTEAELIVGMLRDHGLDAMVSADDLARLDLALQAQGVRVLVAPDEATAAMLLLDRAADETAPPKLNRAQRWLVRLLGGRPE